jgi:hypothetical protein
MVWPAAAPAWKKGTHVGSLVGIVSVGIVKDSFVLLSL